MSGFFNKASGSAANGQISGFFNTGVPDAGFLPGFSGSLSGALNTGSGLPGFFSITALLRNLS